jgi:hypothetical protein
VVVRLQLEQMPHQPVEAMGARVLHRQSLAAARLMAAAVVAADMVNTAYLKAQAAQAAAAMLVLLEPLTRAVVAVEQPFQQAQQAAPVS